MDTIVPTVQVVEAKANPASTISLERSSIQTLKNVKRAKQDEIESLLMADQEYKDKVFEMEAAATRIGELKQIITDGSDKIKLIKKEIREINRSLKDHQLSLSDALRDYTETTKQLTFEGMLIVKDYKLKERK